MKQRTTPKGKSYWEVTVTGTINRGDDTLSETVVATNEFGSWMIPPTGEHGTYRELLSPASIAISDALRKRGTDTKTIKANDEAPES